MPKLKQEIIPLKYAAQKVSALLKWYDVLELKVANNYVIITCKKKLKKVREI